MRTYTDKQLLDRVQSLPTFKGWPKGVLEIALRSKADEYDKFDDKNYTFDCRSGVPVFVMVRNTTTNSGSYGLKHFDEYNHLGCAVLKSDTIVYDSHEYGLHKGKPAYRQVKGFPYFRDANRNEKAEEIGPEYHDVIAANIHRAGQNSTVIKNWSVACIVTATLSKFLAWLDFLVKAGKPKVSLCILKEFTIAKDSAAASSVSNLPETAVIPNTGESIVPVAEAATDQPPITETKVTEATQTEQSTVVTEQTATAPKGESPEAPPTKVATNGPLSKWLFSSGGALTIFTGIWGFITTNGNVIGIAILVLGLLICALIFRGAITDAIRMTAAADPDKNNVT